MKKFTYICLIGLITTIFSCSEWTLPEACNEATPTDFTLNVVGDVVNCSIAGNSANWTLVSSIGKIVKEGKASSSFTFNKNHVLPDNYQIKVSGTTSCNFAYNFQKNLCSESLPKKISYTFNDATGVVTITCKSTIAGDWTITDKAGFIILSVKAADRFTFKMLDYVGKITNIRLSGKSLCGEAFNFSVLNPFYFEMVRIDGEEFNMGDAFNNSPKIDNELPAHKVKVSDFLMSKAKVKVVDWFNYMNSDNGIHSSMLIRSRSLGGSYSYAQVETFNEIQPFIDKINSPTNPVLRLPTEAEWEYVVGYAKSNGRPVSSIYRVGEMRYPLRYDISYDYVAEFVGDYYAPYSAGPTLIDPKGPSSGAFRIFKGGTGKYESSLTIPRIAFRGLHSTTSTFDYFSALTFRLVMDIP